MAIDSNLGWGREQVNDMATTLVDNNVPPVDALSLATAFTGSGPPRLVRRGLLVSGAVCLFGLVGAATGNMSVRDIGIAGYAVILPVVLLVMARVFAATAVAETPR